MRRTCLFAAAVATLLPSPGRAAWVLGARTGYAMPFGDESTGRHMADLVSGQVPLQLELGYRVRRLTVGAYGSYGFGTVSGDTRDLCRAADQRCSSTSLRVGGQVSYSFGQPPAPLDPWIGLGIGYESITVKRFTDLTMSGSEWIILQGGLDWRLGAAASVGAFASLSFGSYTDQTGAGASGVILDRRWHEWLTLGIRGTYAFGG